ncbi:MAG: hypothetical protein KKB38_20750 [Gammaproteobacteria bacterium]|nr:hypothetical protein [Gammaproteobacteria bacterium]
MARGAPDYSNVRVASPVHQVSDLGELAVRLGGVSVHDRAGNVTLIDSFEYGNGNWFHGSPVADSSQIVTSAYSRHGAFSLKLTPASSSPYGVHVYRFVPFTSLGKFGAEISFTVTSNTQYIIAKQEIYTGTEYHRCEVRYDDVNSKIQYLNAAPSWVDLDTDIKLSKADRLFHTIKLVCDPVTATYDRILLDGLKYENLGLPYYTSASVISAFVQFGFSVNAETGAQTAHYIDSLVLTQNEP